MNNFGIVTHFTMRALRQGQFYAGSRSFTADKRDAVLDQAYQLTTTWKNDTAMAFYYTFDYDLDADDYTFTVNEEYAYPILDPQPFGALNQIPFESSTLRVDWPSKFSAEGVSPSGGR